MRVALIGIGNMGKPMGRNMLNSGHSVTAYDVVPEAAEYLVQFGGKVAGSAAATEGVDIVMTMLPTHDHVREVRTESFPAFLPAHSSSTAAPSLLQSRASSPQR
jgi:3-hydroxyisobutyrate dehydrogenase-like beta-hydroxyacid dehydrogenase